MSRINDLWIKKMRDEYDSLIYGGQTSSDMHRILDALESAYAELDRKDEEIGRMQKLLDLLQARYDERWGDLKDWMYSPKELRRYGWQEGEQRIEGVGLFPVGSADGSVPFQAFLSISDPQGILHLLRKTDPGPADQRGGVDANHRRTPV